MLLPLFTDGERLSAGGTARDITLLVRCLDGTMCGLRLSSSDRDRGQGTGSPSWADTLPPAECQGRDLSSGGHHSPPVSRIGPALSAQHTAWSWGGGCWGGCPGTRAVVVLLWESDPFSGGVNRTWPLHSPPPSSVP